MRTPSTICLRYYVFAVCTMFALCTHASQAATKTPNAAPSLTKTIEPQCSDFLAELKKKPQTLEFLECQRVKRHGLSALESKYRVDGIHASKIENYFVKTARMPKLRFNCCGWESFPDNIDNAGALTKPTHGLLKSKQNQYEVTMTSGESLVGQRTRWREIPYFYVTVTRYLELP